MPVELRNHYVFLTSDRHTVVVVVPERPDTGPDGRRRVVRVPLRNDLRPFLSFSISKVPSGEWLYQYTVSNGAGAADSIGAYTLIVPAGNPPLRSLSPTVAGHRLFAGGIAPGGPAIAKQAIFPEAPLGRYLLWYQQDEHVIRPGEELAGFGVQTSYLPGLTTAWFSSGELLDIDQSWPPEIFQDLVLLEDRRWREKFVVTIGPCFAPDAPSEPMVESFRTGLRRMRDAGWLDSSSPFVKEIAAVLENWPARPPHEAGVLHQRPTTPLESEIAKALEVSLHLVFEGR